MPLPSRRVGRHRRRQPSRVPGVVAAASLGAAVIGGLNVPQAAAGRGTSVDVPVDAALASDQIDPATVAAGVAALRAATREQEELRTKAALAARATAKARADRAKADRVKAEKEAEPDFVTPVARYRFSSDYGYRSGIVSGFHSGVDLAAPIGTPVHAVGAGTVIMAGRAGGYGNRVVIRHTDGTVTYYAHLNSISVHSGAVEPGAVIGEVGTTGHSTGPHLHLEVRPDAGDTIDPEAWLAARGVTL